MKLQFVSCFTQSSDVSDWVFFVSKLRYNIRFSNINRGFFKDMGKKDSFSILQGGNDAKILLKNLHFRKLKSRNLQIYGHAHGESFHKLLSF